MQLKQGAGNLSGTQEGLNQKVFTTPSHYLFQWITEWLFFYLMNRVIGSV
jgi:hypothetical protein